jgi:hypothetical protein
MISSHLENVHEAMIHICNHIAVLVEEYGATSVFVAWMGPCRNIRVALSSNVNYRAKDGLSQTLCEIFGSLFLQYTGINARHPLLLPLRLISRQGCHPSNQVVFHMWSMWPFTSYSTSYEIYANKYYAPDVHLSAIWWTLKSVHD